MAMYASSADVVPSFVPLRLHATWNELFSGFSASSVAQRIVSARVFRAMSDGSDKGAVDMDRESGGVISDLPVLQRLRRDLEGPAGRELRQIASASHMFVNSTRLDTHVPRQLVPSTPESAALVTMHGSEACPTSWPTAPRPKRALEGDPKARELAETRERAKWVSEIRDIVVAARLPVVAVAAKMSRPESVLSSMGRGWRRSTLRRRVLDWRPAARFLSLTVGRSWPNSIADVLDYPAALADGNAGRAAMGMFLYALRFLELAGGVSTRDQLACSPLLGSKINGWICTILQD